ncbi:Hypothetical protein CHC_T00008411001 [Chondrus crispus]|uniref:Uncharacterized protein n=1 Tax=Chondrus crispus TaxID=2769 RepID=R7QQ04_CHOCR|nr:Hypothetical protein CHC_T00008411001 [Chondrus crispus]CDF40567.1 Hypothetical protein CHC_T00008411001 [Chondrus crispus]|eukprot:XP_005710861.1 Hypothetical protein CHC_T00008411001 [Chondrus crispus]
MRSASRQTNHFAYRRDQFGLPRMLLVQKCPPQRLRAALFLFVAVRPSAPPHELLPHATRRQRLAVLGVLLQLSATMPQLYGDEIYHEESGLCLKCGGGEGAHQLIYCTRQIMLYGNIRQCGGICMYRMERSGAYNLCSICPNCRRKPIGFGSSLSQRRRGDP